MNIGGRTALVTGATGGIGGAIARALAQRGARLVLSGRRVEALEPLAGELGARVVPADLSRQEDVERLAAEAADTEILVSNAGLPASGPLEEYTPEQLQRAVDVNFRAPVMLAHALGPRMIERGGGHIVFINSTSGMVPTYGQSLYVATKFGLRGFALALRQDWDAQGVGVSSVLPSFIRDAGIFADSGVQLPRGARTKAPEDVAAAVVRAIEHNVGEIEVAPLSMRLGTRIAIMAPELAAGVTRRLGGERVAAELTEAQRDKR